MPSKTNQEAHSGAVREERSTGIISLVLGEGVLQLQPLLLKDREHNTNNQPLGDLVDFWLILRSSVHASLVNEAELPNQGFFSLSGLLHYVIFHRQYGKSCLSVSQQILWPLRNIGEWKL